MSRADPRAHAAHRRDDQADGARHAVVKRSVVIAGHRTSISLEQPFWAALQDLAARRGCSVNQLVARIDADRAGEEASNLSSALRVFVLECSRRGELALTAAPPRG